MFRSRRNDRTRARCVAALALAIAAAALAVPAASASFDQGWTTVKTSDTGLPPSVLHSLAPEDQAALAGQQIGAYVPNGADLVPSVLHRLAPDDQAALAGQKIGGYAPAQSPDTVTLVSSPHGSGFDWTDAGIGVALGAGLVLLGAGAVLVRRRLHGSDAGAVVEKTA
jgi:hypothetical protein